MQNTVQSKVVKEKQMVLYCQSKRRVKGKQPERQAGTGSMNTGRKKERFRARIRRGGQNENQGLKKKGEKIEELGWRADTEARRKTKG